MVVQNISNKWFLIEQKLKFDVSNIYFILYRKKGERRGCILVSFIRANTWE